MNVSGTGNKPNTRLLTLWNCFNKKTMRAAQTYRTAWSALHTLDPEGSWMSRLKELKDKDISGPGKEPEDVSTTNSRYEPSWIWLVAKSGSSDLDLDEEEFNDCMRIEWAKARARMMRWKEELLIIQEEMRRVIAYHKWKAAWWRDRSVLRNQGDATLLSGLSGYANKQAALCTHMAERCALYWLPYLMEEGLTPVWASEYKNQLTVQTEESEDEGLDGGGEDWDIDVGDPKMDVDDGDLDYDD